MSEQASGDTFDRVLGTIHGLPEYDYAALKARAALAKADDKARR